MSCCLATEAILWYRTSMTENNFNPLPSSADISAYENTDLSQLNAQTEEVKPTEKRLENFLIRMVFTAKVCAWIGIISLVVFGLYGWTRNQSQDSWLMNVSINTAGSPLCTWMNRGYDANLRKDNNFRDYLTAQGKQSFIELLESGKCIAPDTIAEWLDLQKTFASDELGKEYAKIISKKFLSTTLTASPELDVISAESPEHRIHHDAVLQILSDATERISEAGTRVSCQTVNFHDLSAEADCQVTTKSPIQPRAKALEFIKSLTNSQSLLVTYPSVLDMKQDEKTNLLTTEFSVQMTYIPSRYEAQQIQKLTYDKR